MIIASDGFQCMMYLPIIEEYVFVTVMFDLPFYYVLFYSICCFPAFVIVFDLTIHLDPKPTNSVIAIPAALSWLMHGDGYETRQVPLFHVFVRIFGLDPAQNTILLRR